MDVKTDLWRYLLGIILRRLFRVNLARAGFYDETRIFLVKRVNIRDDILELFRGFVILKAEFFSYKNAVSEWNFLTVRKISKLSF